MTDSIAQTPHHEIEVSNPIHDNAPSVRTDGNTVTSVDESAMDIPVRAVAKKPVVKANHNIPALLQFPYKADTQKEDQTNDANDLQLSSDSLASDTLTVAEGEEMQGIVLIDPASAYRNTETETDTGNSTGMSWIYLGLALLFCLTAIRFKGSSKYLKALFNDLTDTRVRHNAFDDTVRETSLLVLLNISWAACAGILLWNLLQATVGHLPQYSLSIPDRPVMGIIICSGIATAYIIAMLLAYWIVGSVFSDRKLTRLWVKGAAASTALQALLLFPLALLALSYPESRTDVLITAGVAFAVGKIIFLYKGFRIFFTQISSWLLFLYYLCSLEIVPLILTYMVAIMACNAWL